MAFLFTVQEKSVFPNTETLLISPFKEIWDRDKTQGKELAIEELTYIEFVTSLKKSNPYRQYPEKLKAQKVQEEIIKREKWKPDELIKKGIEFLIIKQKEASTTYRYYISAKIAAEKMQEFFENFDINERNPKTFSPIYKPADITRALNDTENVLSKLKALEKKVEEELYESTKTQGGKEISPFANPQSLKA